MSFNAHTSSEDTSLCPTVATSGVNTASACSRNKMVTKSAEWGKNNRLTCWDLQTLWKEPCQVFVHKAWSVVHTLTEWESNILFFNAIRIPRSKRCIDYAKMGEEWESA